VEKCSDIVSNKAWNVLMAGVILLVPTGVGHFSEQTGNRIDFELKGRRFF